MNKQEVLGYILEENRTHQKDNLFQRGYRTAMSRVYDRVKQLDEPVKPPEPKPWQPEKPILTKEEAEWFEGLKEAHSKLPKIQLIYFIVRQGWGYLFEYKEGYEEANHVLKPQLYPDEVYPPDLKERLLNAALYGYEVEKEKLYTARLKVITKKEYAFINKESSSGNIFIYDLRVPKNKYQVYFTQKELEELNVWDSPAFEVEEVEE